MGERDRLDAARYEVVSVQGGSSLYTRVLTLGESQRKFVGRLPWAAWEDYAAKGRIRALVAPSDPSTPFAYVAFRLPRSEVAIAHLVVAPSHRGRGLARRLVTELSGSYPERTGLTLLCRRDFPAHKMWPQLGFVPSGDQPGRGKDGKPLTRWWFDHGHPHLLTWQGAPQHQRPVVLDNNIFLDLHGEGGHIDKVSREVLLGTLNDQLELLVTPEIHTEIDRSAPSGNRARLHGVANTYPSLSVAPSLLARSLAALQKELGAPQSFNPRDVSDIRHVAYAGAAGVDLMVTRDQPAIARLGEAALRGVGVRLVTPQDLVTLVDEEENAPRYWPAALLGTGYSVEELSSSEEDVIVRFLATGSGERKTALRASLRDLAAAGRQGKRRLVRDPGGIPVALLGARTDEGRLIAQLLRVRPGPLSASLAAHVVNGLREIAGELGCHVICIRDNHMDDLTFAAAERDGFTRSGSDLMALAINSSLTCAGLDSAISALISAEDLGLLPTALKQAIRDPRDAATAAALEHQLRPLRLVDADLPTMIVPIKPVWSAQLFHSPLQLVGPPDHLGISREHVYYRSPRREPAPPPARILWYASKPSMELIACSSLLEVNEGTPEQLWRRYRRLGVYDRAQVVGQAATNGRVRALRVADTEVFDRPVSLRTMNRLARELGCPRPQLISPSRISSDLFRAIIEEARG